MIDYKDQAKRIKGWNNFIFIDHDKNNRIDMKEYNHKGLIEAVYEALGLELEEDDFDDFANDLDDKIYEIWTNYQSSLQSKDQYDSEEESKSIIIKAVDFIESKYKFVSIVESDEILYYENGVYVSGGEALIERLAQVNFREDMTTHRIREIKEHIRRDNQHKIEEFDPGIHIINMENGLYNWKEID